MPQSNIWQTKLLVKETGPENYLLNPNDVNHPLVPEKMKLLHEEMHEIYHMMH
jgi:S-adenosylmethionine decarboxylase